jgi:hypothetical protein
MSAKNSEVISDWASSLGIVSEQKDWVIGCTLSTAPIENWFYKRNALKAEDIKLEINVPSYGLWCAELARHDRLFHVQWRPSNDLRIESQQMKYKRLIKWPELTSPHEFPNLVGKIEDVMGIKFIRHVNVGARNINVDSLLTSKSAFHTWLSVCADTIGQGMTAGPTDTNSYS